MPKQLPKNEIQSRDEFFQREDRAWKALTNTWVDMPEVQFLIPGACGQEWSVKDVIHHMAAWQEAAQRVVNDLLAGKWGRLGMSTERFNAQHFALDRERPLDEAFQRLDASREMLLVLLATVQEDQLLNEFGQQQIGWWAKWTTYAHYEQHLAELNAFRDKG